MTRRPSIVQAVAVIVLAVAAVLAVAGVVSLWLPILLAALPLGVVLARRIGGFAALGGTLLTIGLLVLALLIATHPLGVPPVPVLATAVVLGGGALILAADGIPTPAELARLAPVAPAALGGLVWLLVVTAARLIPGATHFAWAMSGDSANNLVFARELVYADGVVLGGGENPVPLTAGVLAVAMLAGRGGVPSDRLLAHDLSAFVDTWAVVIAILGTLIGAVVAQQVPAERRALRGMVGAAASLLVLTWFVTGYPIEFGFLNTHLALVAVLAAWLVFPASARRPALVLGLLAVACTMVLAIWTPLVLFPGALAVVVVLRRRTALLRGPRSDLVLGIVGCVQLVAYGLVMTLPTLLVQGAYLAAPGGAYPFSRLAFAGLVVALLVLAVLAGLRRAPELAWGAVASALGASAGFAVLLYGARTAPNPWISYYPVKFSWLAGVALFVLVAALAVFLAVRLTTSRVLGVVGVAVVALGTVVASQVVVRSTTGYVQSDPVSRVLKGDFWHNGDEAPLRIQEYADLEGPTILWNTGDPNEFVIDFWVLQVQSDSMSENLDLKYIAYGAYDVDEVADLCTVFELVDSPLRVLTADPELEDAVTGACGPLVGGDQIVVVSR